MCNSNILWSRNIAEKLNEEIGNILWGEWKVYLKTIDKNEWFELLGDLKEKFKTEEERKEHLKELLDGKDSFRLLYLSERKHNEDELVELLRPSKIEKGVHKCRSCGSEKTISYSRQTRSMDEPATVFVSCANPKCGKKWKEG